MEKHPFNVNSVITGLRPEMNRGTLEDEQLAEDPFLLFESWLHDAITGGDAQANAMALSTIGSDGTPDARTVLLRNLSYGGFTFYTNYNSKKGKDLDHQPAACLLFFWREQLRQVKIKGAVKRMPQDESDAYFASRPIGHQLGAWASQQSEVVASRAALDLRYQEIADQFGNGNVPRPPHWGGYVLIPTLIEFWQGRADRLHDRVRYRFEEQAWHRQRLMP